MKNTGYELFYGRSHKAYLNKKNTLITTNTNFNDHQNTLKYILLFEFTSIITATNSPSPTQTLPHSTFLYVTPT